LIRYATRVNRAVVTAREAKKEPPMTSMRRWQRKNADTDAVYAMR